MRLLLIGPVYPYRGGISHFTTLLYQAFERRGVDVELISFRRLYPSWLFPGQSDKDPSDVHFADVGAKYWLDTLNPLTWLYTAVQIARSRPHIIVFQWYTTFLVPLYLILGGLCRVFTPCSILFICHNVLPHETRIWDRWLSRLVLQMGHFFVVQSTEELRRLRKMVSRGAAIVNPLPLFRLPAEWRHVDRARACAWLGIPPDRLTLLFFGLVRPYKGLEEAIRAVALLKGQEIKVTLIVAGEFWENRAYYEDLVSLLGLRDEVIFHDRYIPNEEVPFYFSAADMLVAPYREVTGSAVIQLARSVRCPVVTTSLPGIQEAVENDPMVCLVEPRNPQALASAIVAWSQSVRLLRERSLEADVDQSWDRFLDRLEDLL